MLSNSYWVNYLTTILQIKLQFSYKLYHNVYFKHFNYCQNKFKLSIAWIFYHNDNFFTDKQFENALKEKEQVSLSFKFLFCLY